MNVTFNRDRRAFMAAVDGRSEFAFHTQLRADEDETTLSDADAVDMFHAAMGAPVGVEVLSRGTWRAGFALVVEHMQSGRIFLGGDAGAPVHAGRRTRLQHRHRGRGEPGMETGGSGSRGRPPFTSGYLRTGAQTGGTAQYEFRPAVCRFAGREHRSGRTGGRLSRWHRGARAQGRRVFQQACTQGIQHPRDYVWMPLRLFSDNCR